MPKFQLRYDKRLRVKMIMDPKKIEYAGFRFLEMRLDADVSVSTC